MKKVRKAKPSKLSKEEVAALIVKLAKAGSSPAEIGITLRDSYGIPSAKAVGLKVEAVLREQGIHFVSDLDRLVAKAEALKKHLERNKHDMVAKRSLQTIEARIRKLASYYRKSGKLPREWRY